MRTFSRRSAIAFTLVVALGAAACGGDDGDGGSGGGGSGGAEVDEMVWGIASPIQSMDIAVMGDVPSQRAQTAAFDRVLVLDNNGLPQPWIASAFDTSDPMKLVLTIRDDVKFWDGTALTSADVAYSIARHTGPESTSMYSFLFGTVASVEATDATTVTITLAVPDPALPAKLAVVAQVRQQKYDEAAGEAAGGSDKPGMGTGAYSITSYSSADGAVLTRNDDYWAGTPKVKQLEFKIIGDPDTARLAMSSGEIDGYFDVPLIATRQWDELDNATMTYAAGAYNDFLSMTVTKAPFDDVNARTAVGHLIDREGLLGPLFNNRATVANSIVPAIQMTSTFGDDGAAAIYDAIGPLPEFSIDKAREALAKSATPDGFTLDLLVDTSQPWMSPLAQHLAENAAQIGITINVKPVSFADWAADLSDPDGNSLRLSALGAPTTWAGELPPVVLGNGSPFNSAGYVNEAIDPLIGAIAAATSVDELRQPLQDALTIVTTDLPYLPLFDEQVATAIANDYVWEGGFTYFALAQAWTLQLSGAG